MRKLIPSTNQNRRMLFFIAVLIIVLILLWLSNSARLHYKIVIIDVQSFFRLAAFSLVLPVLAFPLIYFLKPIFPSMPSQLHNKLLIPLRLIVFVLVFFLLGWGSSTTFNAFLDKGPLYVCKVKVIEKKTRQWRFFTDYVLIVTSWIPNENLRKIDLTRDEYSRLDLKDGDCLNVGLGQGALGFKWIASIEKTDETGGQYEAR